MSRQSLLTSTTTNDLVVNNGSSANDRTGDSLRAAFEKVKTSIANAEANFIELYQTSAGTANTGFVDDKIYNMNGPVLSNDDLVHGATARLALPAYGNTNPVSLLNYYGSVAITAGLNPSSTVGWTFNNTGTLTTPLLLPKTFTAVLDTAHMASPVALTDTPWEFVIEFQVNPDGTVQTMIGNNTPWLVNPGYNDGYQFTYTEADHGIPGYTFTLGLQDVVQAGPAGWTTNLTASIPPTLPPTIESQGAVIISSNTRSWSFGTDGVLTLPPGADILDSTGNSILNIIDGGAA